MKKYTFRMSRAEYGYVTIESDDYFDALEQAYDYTKRIVHVNNLPWYELRTVNHKLITEEEQ